MTELERLVRDVRFAGTYADWEEARAALIAAVGRAKAFRLMHE